MNKSCRYCGRIHNFNFECPKKPKRENRTDSIARFRRTQAWRNKSNEIMERDLYLCRVCYEQGKLTNTGLSVHHIVSLASNFDLRLENDNLITLCDEHHKAAEKGNIEAIWLKKLATKELGVSPLPREVVKA